MGYSNDLRVRVIQVVESGTPARAAARQFVIGDSTAIRWAKRWRETGSFEAKSNKGQSRSPLKQHEEWLLELVRREPDLTLEEIQRRLRDERAQGPSTTLADFYRARDSQITFSVTHGWSAFLEGPTMVSRTSVLADELGRWVNRFLYRMGNN